MPKVFNYDEVDVTNIIIQKPIKYGKHIVKFPIKYRNKSKKKNLIIQSPKMYLPFQVMNFTNYLVIDYSFCNIDFDPKQNIFLILLNEINVKIRKLIKNGYFSFYFKNNKMISSIKSKFMYPNILRTKIYNKNHKNLEIYDQNKKRVTFEEIKSSLYCKSLLYLSDIWISLKKKSYGLTWNTLQMRIDLPLYLRGYSFLEEKKDENHYIKNHKIYKKYFKMLNLGIPSNAIKQKMMMNGDNPNILNCHPETISSKVLLGNDKKKVLLSNTILKSVKLKQTIKNDKVKKKKKDNRVPSLEDILNTKSNLNKTGVFHKLI